MFNQIGKDESFSEILNRFDEGYLPWIDAGYGWANLVKECHEKLFSFDPNYKVVQIKEKFGGLRYYFNPSNPVYTRIMHDKIIPVERRSYTVCEMCGNEAKLRKSKTDSWLRTLCNHHALNGLYEDAAQQAPVQIEKPINSDNNAKSLSLYPIVIRESRYGGTYEKGRWHAIPNCESLETWDMNYFDYLNGDDHEAVKFWLESESAKKIGVGNTPNDALSDLFSKNFI